MRRAPSRPIAGRSAGVARRTIEVPVIPARSLPHLSIDGKTRTVTGHRARPRMFQVHALACLGALLCLPPTAARAEAADSDWARRVLARDPKVRSTAEAALVQR